MTEHEKLARGKQQVKAATCFYAHLAIFAMVITALLVINIAASPVWWVQWPFLGWGIGVLSHAWAVFGRRPGALTRWQAKKAREDAEKL